jgi:hypothetical protein
MAKPGIFRRRWGKVAVAAALAVGTATAGLVVGVGASAQTPPSPSCKAVKGSFTQWQGSTPNTMVGVFKGSIAGSYTMTFIGEPNISEWGVLTRADVVVTQKKASPILLSMNITGTDWTTSRAISGGWMQTPQAESTTQFYNLSIMLEPFISQAGGTWSYTGQFCQR